MEAIVIQEENKSILAEIKSFLIQKNVNFSVKQIADKKETEKILKNIEQNEESISEKQNQEIIELSKSINKKGAKKWFDKKDIAV